jgi:hypothetical protein
MIVALERSKPMKSLPVFAFGLICALVCGCAYHLDEHYTVSLDPTFTPTQQEAIIAGIDNWAAMLGDRFSYEVNVGGCEKGRGQVCIHASTRAFVDTALGTSAGLGYTTRTFADDSSDVYLPTDDNVSDALFQQIATHEEGHAWGLHHTEEGTLMCANTGCAALFVTCEDVVQYSELRGEFQPECK